MARRIESVKDLKDVIDQLDVEMAQRLLDHDAFVVWQRWKNDPPDYEPELHGRADGGCFASFSEAMTVRDEIHAQGLQAHGWIATHGEPVTLVVPVWRQGE